MRVLVACEFTGKVRDAFAALGHDAWSSDFLPTEAPGNHYQGNVLDILSDGWDLLIGHPPCTFLSYVANSYWDLPGRARKRIEALDFFLKLWEAPAERICLENPLGVADRVITRHHQIIEPFYFGDSDRKRTCLWLKNLPPLKYTLEDNLFEQATAVPPPEPIYTDKSGKRRYFNDAITGRNGGGHLRSKTFPGIASAMAEQWGQAIESVPAVDSIPPQVQNTAVSLEVKG